MAQRVLAAVLDGLCRLLHPIVPFLTEQVWQALGQVAPRRGLPEPEPAAESVCIASWPAYPAAWADAGAEQAVGLWQEVTKALRNLRAERNIPKEARIAPIVIAAEPAASNLRLGESFIRALAQASSLTLVPSADRPEDSAVVVLADVEIILPLADLIDKEAEAARQRKTLAEINKQLGSVQGKLRNESFISRAPAEVVAQQRAKEAELLSQRAAVLALLGEG
jgi:valyl-tRNA synthetase